MSRMRNVLLIAVLGVMALTGLLFVFLAKSQKSRETLLSASGPLVLPGLKYPPSSSKEATGRRPCLVYDLLHASQQNHLEALLSHLTEEEEGGGGGGHTKANGTSWSFLFLLPDASGSSLPPFLQSFCQRRGLSEAKGCRVYAKHSITTTTAPFSYLVAAIASTLSEEEADSVFFLSSAWLGPFLPAARPLQPLHSSLTSFLRDLRHESPLVVSDLFASYDHALQKVLLSLQSPSSPLPPMAMTFRLVRALHRLFEDSFSSRLSSGELADDSAWALRNLLASGLSFQALSPSFHSVDWLKVHRLCHNPSPPFHAQPPATAHPPSETVTNMLRSIARSPRSKAHLSLFDALSNNCQDLFQTFKKDREEQKHGKSANHFPLFRLAPKESPRHHHQSLQRQQQQQQPLPSTIDEQATVKQAKTRGTEGRALSAEQKDNGKTLVIYVYFEASEMAKSNLLYFLRIGVQPSPLVDYVVIVQGQSSLRILSLLSNASSASSSSTNSSSLRDVRDHSHTAQLLLRFHNLQVLYHSNTCFDIGTWGQILTYLYQSTQSALRYRYFIILNSSIRGPYLPAVWPSAQTHMWSTILTSKLSEKVKLVGLAVNCPDGRGRKLPHVMSMVLAFDQKTVDIWMKHQQPASLAESQKRRRRLTMSDIHASKYLPSTYKNISQILYCASAKQQSYLQESELSLAVLSAGYEITSMQPYYDLSWREYWLDINQKNPPFELSHGKFWTCPGVQLDIFYQPGWDRDGHNPHPWNYLFVKTNRGIYGKTVSEVKKNLDRLAHPSSRIGLPRRNESDMAMVQHLRQPEEDEELEVFEPNSNTSVRLALHAPRVYHGRHLSSSSQFTPVQQRHCVLFTHTLAYDGAPIWLLRVVPILQAEGYLIKIFSLSPGPLATAFEKANVEVIKLPSIPPAPSVRAKDRVEVSRWLKIFNEKLQEESAFAPSLYIFNTVLFLRFVQAMPLFKKTGIYSLWAIHEAELYEAVKDPRGRSFDNGFPELKVPGSTYFAANRILFVSDSGREFASRFDFGQFVTIRGFISPDSCPWLPSETKSFGADEMVKLRQEKQEQARKMLKIPSDAYVVTNIGTICRRKQQHWLIDFYLKLAERNKRDKDGKLSVSIRGRPLYVLLIGYTGGDASPTYSYERDLVQQVKTAGLDHRILFIPKSTDPFSYALAADLHTSLSTHESFPLNTLEAMCYGIPIMATPAFGVREQIIRPGVDGILLPSTRSFDAFNRAIQSFFGIALLPTKNDEAEKRLHEVWRGIGLEGSNTLRQYFTEQAVRPYFQKLLKDVAKEEAGAAGAAGGGDDEVEPSPQGKVCIVMRIHGKQVDKGQQQSADSSIIPPALAQALNITRPPVGLEKKKKKSADYSHNDNQFFNLEESIRSLYLQDHKDWELLLLPSDQSAFDQVYPLLVRYNHYNAVAEGSGSHHRPHHHHNHHKHNNSLNSHSHHRHDGGQEKSTILSEINRIRLVVHHDQLLAYHPEEYASFHQHLYELTDSAISQCSPDSDWLLVTNGDNTYHRSFLSHLDRDYDLIAYDFFSRWFMHLKNPLPPCDRLMISQQFNEYWEADKETFPPDHLYYNHSLPFKKNHEKVLGALSCKRNELRQYGTDLGANVLNLRRWRAEGHRFASTQTSDASQDGVMIGRLVSPPFQWRVKRVHAPKEAHHQCLFDHNPNYHACMRIGSDMRWDDSKHRCVELDYLVKNEIPFEESELRGCIRTFKMPLSSSPSPSKKPRPGSRAGKRASRKRTPR